MSMAEERKPAIEIHSIMLNEGGVEISYAEEGDVSSSGVLMIRTIMIPRALVADEVEELVQAATDVVDAGLVAKRAPVSAFRRR